MVKYRMISSRSRHRKSSGAALMSAPNLRLFIFETRKPVNSGKQVSRSTRRPSGISAAKRPRFSAAVGSISALPGLNGETGEGLELMEEQSAQYECS